MKFRRITIIFLILFSSCRIFAQTGKFPGIKLRPEIQAIVKEIETKSGEEIYAEFIRHNINLCESRVETKDWFD